MRNPPEINSILNNKVQHTLTNFIYPNLLTTLPILIFAASIVVFKLYGHVSISKEYLIVWLAALLVTVVCQGILAIWFQKTKFTLKWDHLYHKLLVINAALIGALWGIAGIVFMPEDAIGQSYLIFTLAFVAAGGLVYLTGSYLTGSLYATGVLIPLAGSVFFTLASQSQHEIYYNVALGIFFYWVFLVAVNYYGSKLYAENVTRRLVIKTLTEDLTNTTEELEKINHLSRTDIEKCLLSQDHRTDASSAPKKSQQHTDTLRSTDTQEVLAIKFLQSRSYARRHHQGLAVFLIDIFNFNDVKARSGKNVANLLLKTAALRLQYCKRETDILARTHENKFILVISEVLLGNEIRSVINRLFKTLHEDVIIDNNKIEIKANIGISLFPKDGESLQDLIKKSEIALHSSYEGNEPLESNFQIYDRDKMSTKTTHG